MDNPLEPGHRIGGVVFIQTKKRESLKDFYLNRLGCEFWLDQGACLIFKFGNFLIEFQHFLHPVDWDFQERAN